MNGWIMPTNEPTRFCATNETVQLAAEEQIDLKLPLDESKVIELKGLLISSPVCFIEAISAPLCLYCGKSVHCSSNNRHKD